MGCCQCIGIEQEFNDKYVQRQLKKFHRQGLNKTTRLLIQALIDRNITGASVLDIGGGFGGIGLRLLNSGVSQYTLVEASPAYATAARQELTSKFSPQLFTVNQGDFVTLSPETMEHDIVTLDRVICCYDDVELLVNTSCQKAKQFYGVVFPIDSAITRIGAFFLNQALRMFHRSFRVFVHPTIVVENILKQHRFHRCFYQKAGIWQIILYEKAKNSTDNRETSAHETENDLSN